MTNGAAPSLQTLKTIWLAMVVGTLSYTAIAYALLARGIIDAGINLGPDVMNIVGAVAVLQIMGSLLLRRRMVAAIPRGDPPEQRMSRYFTACIIALALIEGGGLLVITLSIVTGIASWALVGGGASAVVMLMARPDRRELEG